jgi:N-acetylmuramoyl-L-alanine amidase
MNPKYITIHCSATVCEPHITRDMIRQWHLNKGWRDIGYHVVIESDGSVKAGRSLELNGAHVSGHNTDNLGICMIGGVDSKGKSVMNFKYDQKEALKTIVKYYQDLYNIPDENVKGHRDWSPDTNNNGVVDTYEWLKDCPCFNVKHWLETDEMKFK